LSAQRASLRAHATKHHFHSGEMAGGRFMNSVFPAALGGRQ